jgi:hypothetical protein
MIARVGGANKARMTPPACYQKIDIAARKMMNRRKPATIGVRSIMPMRGMYWRMGARIGSVISWTMT